MRTVEHDNLLLFFLISFCHHHLILSSFFGTRVLHLTCPLGSQFLCLCQAGPNPPSELHEEHVALSPCVFVLSAQCPVRPHVTGTAAAVSLSR